jgi:protein-S-isoprenylcysteine O-methyltransferase Ste14
MVTGVIPGTILVLTGVDTLDLWQSNPATRVGLPVVGAILLCLGLVLMVATIRLFVTVGQGTLAPWDPTQRLVVQGVYRHVRNPMIAGVLFVLLGEAILAASLPLLGWFALAVIVNAVYIPLSEEPGLVKRFGADYLAYQQNVPRWIPRLWPWPSEPPGVAGVHVGGVTEAWRIAWMADEHNIQWVPHGWNTAVGLAADLALVASIPVARYVEYLTPSPYIEEIITEPFKVDADGYLPIPDKPGLGIELNREALQKYGC